MAAKPRVHEIASELGVDSKVALDTTGPSQPGVISPVDSDDYTHVVMPMFVQW